MHWMLDSDHSQLSVGAAQICRLISQIGNMDRAALAGVILETLNHFVPVHMCTVLAYESDRNPRLLSAASQPGTGNGDVDNQWSTFRMASLYVSKFFRQDRLMRVMATVGATGNGVLMHRECASDVASGEYRESFYEHGNVVDRVVAMVQVGKGQWVSVQLHRSAAQGCFNGAELEILGGLAPLFVSCAVRHYKADIDGESGYRGAVTAGIGELCPTLTTREREVVLRILDGLTTERIAADLAIRPTTVITYRTRAYEKLGVSSRRELFAVVLRNQGNGEAGTAQEADAAPQSLLQAA